MNTTRGNEPAYPQEYGPYTVKGLTIREHFAGLAMQGWMASFGGDPDEMRVELFLSDHAHVAKEAVKFADALIAELAKEQKP